MKIELTSVLVDDQDEALAFYTDVLGFVKKTEMPAGEHKWLTVVSPEGSGEIELLLEPNAHPAANAFQKALYEDGIPATMFFTDDVQKEYEKLSKRGVVFRVKPTKSEHGTYAVFEDTCGNLINLFQG